MTPNKFTKGTDLFDSWRTDVLDGTPPPTYDFSSSGLDGFRLGPGAVALIGGAPGMGKTAFVMQLVVSAMLANLELSACIVNVEMPPQRLLERQLSRLSGVKLDDIQQRKLSQSQKVQVTSALEQLWQFAKRVIFVQSPFNLTNVAHAVDVINAELIVLDYIQRIHPPSQHDDKRASVNATMDSIRQIADVGHCALVLSAVGRSKDSRGRSSYDGSNLSLASFRESSELEYGADDAYLLTEEEAGEFDFDDSVVPVTLRHLKSRYGNPIDMQLTFDRTVQSFKTREDGSDSTMAVKRSLASLYKD